VLPQQQAAGGGAWPPAAVHDTVASIMRDAAYQRSLSESLWNRFWSWFGDWLLRTFGGVRDLPHLRWIVIGLTTLVVLAIAARLIYSAGRFERESARLARVRAGIRGDPWLEAQRAAAEGRFTDAAHALYHAVLESLAARERIRLHDSKTHGDYARELRAVGSPEHTRLRAFGRRFDRAIFGAGRCDANDYHELLALATPLLHQREAA
jgi:hypothetical protein